MPCRRVAVEVAGAERDLLAHAAQDVGHGHVVPGEVAHVVGRHGPDPEPVGERERPGDPHVVTGLRTGATHGGRPTAATRWDQVVAHAQQHLVTARHLQPAAQLALGVLLAALGEQSPHRRVHTEQDERTGVLHRPRHVVPREVR